MDRKRITEIDLARSLAIIAMIIFHFFFILNFYNIAEFNTNQGILLYLGNFSRFTFISLVGISLAISSKAGSDLKKKVLHGLKIFGIACLISLITYLFIPENFVRFGILHLIGLGIIIFAPIAGRKYLALLISILILILSYIIDQSDLSSSNYFAYILGISAGQGSIDYFPLLPWSTLIAFGVFLGNIIKNHHLKNFQIPRILTFLSKNSLMIYLLHVPLIILLFICLGFLPK